MSYTLPKAADSGFKDAASYDSHRPSYTPEVVQCLLTNLQIKGQNKAKILDLAAGTGKFTELLSRSPEEYEIVAVEPHDEMRAELEKKSLKGVTIKKGHSTSIPLEDGWADAVMIAQAFHWFANVESLKEIARVLKPGGFLGMTWNIEDYNQPKGWRTSTNWEESLKQNIWSLTDNHARFRHEEWRKPFEDSKSISNDQEKPILFSTPLQEAIFPFSKWLLPEQVWDRYHTLSQILVLEPEEKKATKERLLKAIEEDTKAPKNDKGEVEVHGQNATVWTQKL